MDYHDRRLPKIRWTLFALFDGLKSCLKKMLKRLLFNHTLFKTKPEEKEVLNSAHCLYENPISAPRKCLVILTSSERKKDIFLPETFSILLIRWIVFNRILYCCHFCHLLERIKAVLPRQSHLSTVTSFLMSIQVSKWVLQFLKWWHNYKDSRHYCHAQPPPSLAKKPILTVIYSYYQA